MKPTALQLSLLLAVAAALHAPPAKGQEIEVHVDATGDAVLRRTDPGNDGPVSPTSVPPDLRRVELMGWLPSSPTTDPYTGTVVNAETADIFRMNVQFQGLVNPPGTLLPSDQFNPFAFGPSPVYGFIELNMDRERNTGGQLPGPGALRYLANVGRLGALPDSSDYGRAAWGAADLDLDFYTAPQFERSGEEFSLVFCGCDPITVIAADGDGDLTFEAGETWIVRGRFFQRAAGYQGASFATGGRDFGLYEPLVQLRFSHDIATGRTTVSLVFPLTMLGAAILTGQPQQAIDTVYDINGNHASVVEALQDLVNGANGLNGGPLSGEALVLTDGWRTQQAHHHLDPTRWRVNALVGTAYAAYEPSLYVWTDAGFDNTTGDFNGDEVADNLDRQIITSAIAQHDGTGDDADGVVNGSWRLSNFSANFCPLDIDGDGVVGPADLAFYGGFCLGDWNRDGTTSSLDISAFLTGWLTSLSGGTLDADFDASGQVNSSDISAFLAAWLGCLG